jgi:hypothetical protein
MCTRCKLKKTGTNKGKGKVFRQVQFLPSLQTNQQIKKHMKRVLNVVLASLIALAFMSAVTILTGENSAQQMFSLAICFTSTALFYILVPKTK